MLDFGFYNMDCIEGMKNFPNKYFDLAITDPPYGIGAGDYKRGGQRHGAAVCPSKCYGRKSWDSMKPTEEYFRELFRVSKNQIIWGGNHLAAEIGKDSPCWIVWDKQTGNNGYADCELAWTSFSSAVRMFTFKWQGMLQGDMKNKEYRIHPTQKPVALYEWLIRKYAKPGDIILDTHVGSGSSLIACHNTQHKYVGFEIDETYYQQAAGRIKQETAQMNIFDFMGGEQ